MNNFQNPSLLTFSSIVQQFADLNVHFEDPHTGKTLEIEKMTVNLPVEISIPVNDEGSVTLQGTPPTQRTETTILPVFHQMRLTIIATNAQ